MFLGVCNCQQLQGRSYGISYSQGLGTQQVPIPGDNHWLQAILHSNSQTLVWASSPSALGSGKPFHPLLWCAGCTPHCLFISAMALCCPNTWAGLEDHSLGDSGKAAFENNPQIGSSMALVTCLELPVLPYSLLHPLQ